MNQKIKEKWVAALRSGEYKQAAGALKVDRKEGPTYCCLGVLCDLYAKEFDEEWETGVNEETRKEYILFLGYPSTLPPDVMFWAGLLYSNPRIDLAEAFGGRTVLADYNDSGYSFEEIAQVIEAQL